MSGKATQDVEYGRPLKLSAIRAFQGFGEQHVFSAGGRMAMSYKTRGLVGFGVVDMANYETTRQMSWIL